MLSRLEELTVATMPSFLGSSSVGLVILLPVPALVSTAAVVTAATKAVVAEVQGRILTEAFSIAIYFVVEDPQVTEIYEAVKSRALSRSLPLTEDFTVVVFTREAEVSSEPKISSVWGLLHGSGRDDSEAASLAVVSHYDTLGILPNVAAATLPAQVPSWLALAPWTTG
eukprot:RCo050712